MPSTVYVVTPDGDERRWIESTLVRAVDAVVVLDDAAALFARLPAAPPACLVTSAEPDYGETLRFVREIRACDAALHVVVLGPYSAFRTAVDIARLESTDFLERPVSVRQLRIVVGKALKCARP